MEDKIIIRGARQHNLKNIDLELPRNKLIVITGVSGSGKSSLAFDTIYAEGQRRYVESLSAYARQFLELMDKPDVELIEGLSPAIAIQQTPPSHNPRSTVGTVTEIYDYLRLLYAKIGKPYCPQCTRPITPMSTQQIISAILSFPKETRLQILAPLVRGRKGEYKELFQRLRREGYTRVLVDGKVRSLEEDIKLKRYQLHNISVIVDRIILKDDVKTRLADSVETALRLANGIIQVIYEKPAEKEKELFLSEQHGCVYCGISFPEIAPRLFSFNSPYGACPECDGLGSRLEVDPELVVPDKKLSIEEGAIAPWDNPITTRRHRWKHSWRSYYYDILYDLSNRYNFSLTEPFYKLPKEIQNIILYGDYDKGGSFEGVIRNLERRYRETESDYVKEEITNKYMRTRTCPACKGMRLKKEALCVKIDGLNIYEVTAKTVDKVLEFVRNLKLTEKEKIITRQIQKEIIARLNFLINVGLDYITLDRPTVTLAGGEAERIHLATQIGSGLVGVLYILDEPTIGLHPRDNRRLLNSLLQLRDLGNTVIVVEHDEEVIRSADWVVDLGPGAGIHGGNVVYSGPLESLFSCEESLTGMYLSGKRRIPIPERRRCVSKDKDKWITIVGARQFNLKNITVKIPLGKFVCVTGVSGSGKSTLIYEILYKGLMAKLHKSKELPGEHDKILGIENIDKVILIDQSPIGRTPRSNPATYTGAFTYIRELFAQVPDARARGYKPGRFSFNVKGGRCENCRGDGEIKIEMQFLPPVYVKCDVCGGKRFNEETLSVRYKGKNIYEVLEMTIEEALNFFGNIPQIKRILQTLYDVGLSYMKLGQPATTLSGGEAQRIKLAAELCRRATGKTLYLLDEPTTGLHFADVEKLLNVLHRLVNLGNTVVVIEHNLEVIKTADWIIDLGPEGGNRGGEVVAEGPPEIVAQNTSSYTGQFLKKILNTPPERQTL
jgi:excinuclease ABC subunit A